MSYGNAFNARRSNVRHKSSVMTPQSQPLPSREADMVKNRAGGFVFKLDMWSRLARFLILGSDVQTYYADAREMTLSNIDGILLCLEEDGLRVVSEIVTISRDGRAPKNDPALYALAIAASFGVHGKPGEALPATATMADRLVRSGNPMAAAVRRAAFDALPSVARTGRHVMQFVGYMQTLRGWGRGPRKAIERWLESFDDERLALQAVKYRQRDGWTMRDILRLASPQIKGEDRRVLIEWLLRRDLTEEEIAQHEERVASGQSATPRRHPVRPASELIPDARQRFRLIDGYHLLQEASSSAEAARIIRSHSTPFECVPTQYLNDRAVWDALLVDMPMTNMIRNLGKMSAVGLLTQGSEAAGFVADRLQDEESLRRARVHPYHMLVALKMYSRGHALLGDLSWTPFGKVNDALDAGFYKAFKAVRPAGKRFMLGIDISGSMDCSIISAGRNSKGGQIPGVISARLGAAAMAMVTSATEVNTYAVGFTAGRGGSWSPAGYRGRSYGGDWGVTPIDLSARRRLDDICKMMSKLPMGGTDCALPVRYALEHGIEVDAFVIYTDNETWAGDMHVSEALKRYRDKMGIPARLVACGMTATEYSVADPEDAGQMNVVGFDSNAPAIISDFVRG